MVDDVISVGRSANTLLYIAKQNSLAIKRKLLIEIFCPMNLQNYPFDSNSCPLQVKSFSRNIYEMEFKLMQDPSKIIDGIKEYDTSIKKLKVDKMNQYNTTFAITGFTINFRRNWYGIAISIFIPSGLIVIISWMR